MKQLTLFFRFYFLISLGLILLTGLFFPHNVFSQIPRITMQTNRDVGTAINLQFSSDSIETKSIVIHGAVKAIWGYVITNQTIIIEGKIKRMSCRSGGLTSLDISQNTELTDLLCDGNELKQLNVSKNKSLDFLSCNNNQLNALDVSKNKKLTYLACGGNNLKTLNVSKNTHLISLQCSNTPLVDLKLSKNIKLESLDCRDMPQLSALNLSKNKLLNVLNCSNMNLTTLNLKANKYLTKLDCGMNPLETICLSSNKKLKELICRGTNLNELDLSFNDSIENLDCSENRLENLCLANLELLSVLDCRHNHLSELDISTNNRSLKHVLLEGNKFAACEIDNLFRQLPSHDTEPGIIFLKYGEISLPGTDGCREYIATEKNWKVMSIFLEPCEDPESHGHHFHEIMQDINNSGNYVCND